MKQLTARDNFGQADFFLVVLNPNNDSQNDTNFFVFSSGQQADAIANPSIGEDFSWSDVWDSAVQIKEDGWTVEMKIKAQVSALRIQEIELPYRDRSHGQSKVSGSIKGVILAGTKILYVIARSHIKQARLKHSATPLEST